MSRAPAILPAADELSCPAAETKVASGGPPQDGEEQADKADAGAPAVLTENSSAVKLAGSEAVVEEQAGVTADKQNEDDGLGDLFQTLPAIRKFEGKHYKSRKEGVRDLAAQVCVFVGEGAGSGERDVWCISGMQGPILACLVRKFESWAVGVGLKIAVAAQCCSVAVARCRARTALPASPARSCTPKPTGEKVPQCRQRHVAAVWGSS